MIGKNGKLVFVAVALAAVAAVLVMVVMAGRTPEETARVLTSDLQYPRGLTPLDDGNLLAAEVMGGRLLRLTPDGEVEAVAEGLPATLGGPAGLYPMGVSAAVEIDGVYYYVVGEFRGSTASTLYRLDPGGEPEAIAGGLGRDGFPATLITNPYDLLSHPEGGFVISDGGRNALLRVTDAGDVSEIVRFPRRPHPDPDVRSRIDVVPTGITYGPDGALYMASFTGYPYTPEFAVVYRVEGPTGGTGAITENDVQVYAEGLSFATDIAFAPDGSLLITEFTTDMQLLLTEHGLDGAEALPGRLVRWRDGVLDVLADDLVTPTSLAVVGDQVFVSEEFAGRISVVPLP